MSKFQIGSTVFNNWTIVRRIGEGSFGEVFEIQRSDYGQLYSAALKVISVPQTRDEFQSQLDDGMTYNDVKNYYYSVVQEVVQEFAIMSKFKGTSNIVSYEDHDVIPHDTGDGWDIIIRMELLTPLKTYTKFNPFTRRDIIRLGIDMLKALELCQKYNVLHRDIKPENIFVSNNGDFKLGDFGIARTVEKTSAGLSKKGTYTYMAPEIYLGKEYGFNVDIYSLGMVLYRLLNRSREPFVPQPPANITVNDKEQALVRRMSGETIPNPYYAEGRLAEIVLKACRYNSVERYSSPAEMRRDLEAILYSTDEAQIIYPTGDNVELPDNNYQSNSNPSVIPGTVYPDQYNDPYNNYGGQATTLLDQQQYYDAAYQTTLLTEENGGAYQYVYAQPDSGVVYQQPPYAPRNIPAPVKKPKKKKGGLIAFLLVVVIAIGSFVGYKFYSGNYFSLVEEGLNHSSSNPAIAKEKFKSALNMPLIFNKSEAEIGYAYALYKSGEYAECMAFINEDLSGGEDYSERNKCRIEEILGCASFERKYYTEATVHFRKAATGYDLDTNSLLNYAVALGRIGDYETCEAILNELRSKNAGDDITAYVDAELKLAQNDYVNAEKDFIAVYNTTEDMTLKRRVLRSLGNLYTDCIKLYNSGRSPIDHPAIKATNFLSIGITECALTHDFTMWEMLANACYNGYLYDSAAPDDYLEKTITYFSKIFELGIKKDYLYCNMYIVYYQAGEYKGAENILAEYAEIYPSDYTPYALKSILYITLENEKPRENRNYSAAYEAYETAKSLVKSGDDQTYFNQLEELIAQLKEGGWIE